MCECACVHTLRRSSAHVGQDQTSGFESHLHLSSRPLSLSASLYNRDGGGLTHLRGVVSAGSGHAGHMAAWSAGSLSYCASAHTNYTSVHPVQGDALLPLASRPIPQAHTFPDLNVQTIQRVQRAPKELCTSGTPMEPRRGWAGARRSADDLQEARNAVPTPGLMGSYVALSSQRSCRPWGRPGSPP